MVAVQSVTSMKSVIPVWSSVGNRSLCQNLDTLSTAVGQSAAGRGACSSSETKLAHSDREDNYSLEKSLVFAWQHVRTI